MISNNLNNHNIPLILQISGLNEKKNRKERDRVWGLLIETCIVMITNNLILLGGANN